MNTVLPGLAKALESRPIDVSRSELTPRQQEIVVLICHGLTWKEIAQRLGISPKTVESHKRDIRMMTKTHDIATLVRWAIRQGLVNA